jgi:hypothetical protein
MFKFVKPAGKNEEGKNCYDAMLLKDVDKIACEFWGVEEHPRFYASPILTLDGHTVEGLNWFDMLGHAIEDCQYRRHENGVYVSAKQQPDSGQGAIFEASAVSAEILRNATIGEKSAEELFACVNFYRPYIELLFHLQNEHGILFEALGW